MPEKTFTIATLHNVVVPSIKHKHSTFIKEIGPIIAKSLAQCNKAQMTKNKSTYKVQQLNRFILYVFIQ